MRVLVIGPVPPPYHGVATFTRDLLAAKLPGIELIHLDTSDRRDASNLGKWDPTNVMLGISNLAELTQRILRERIDVVYIPISQNVPAFLRDGLFIQQARMLGRRVVIHLHGGYFRTLYDQDAGAAFRGFARAAFKSVDRVIVLSEMFREIFSGLIADEKICVAENGVNDSGAWELKEGGRQKAEGGAVALFMGTLSREKGILTAIEAVAEARKQISGLRLRVAGTFSDPETERGARNIIESDKLNNAVEFCGNVTDAAKAEFLASGEIFLLPTRYMYEGQPLVLLEAMAAGLPILATAHAAIPTTISEGEHGRILPRESSGVDFGVALSEVVANPQLLSIQGRSCRERYLKQYTLQQCHERLAKALRG